MRTVLCFCALWLLACTHSSPSAPAGGSQELSPREDSRIAGAYSTRPSAGILVGEASDEGLRSALSSVCRESGMAPDGRLAELARAVARATRGEAPSAALVSYHAQRLGLSDPTPQLWIASASGSGAVHDALTAAVQRAASLERLTHCGGAAVSGGLGVVVAIALSRRLVNFERDIPRKLATGEGFVLTARLAQGYDQPSLAITHAHGQVERVALPRGRKVRHELRFPQPGEATVELLASGAEGVTVVALLTLAVGIEPSLRAPSLDPQSVEASAEEAAAKLAELIAAERAQRGLPALTPDGALTRVALSHTHDMLEHHFVAHTSRSSGEAQDRVARAGLHTVVLLENIGRGYSAAEIHGGLMESPGHRANILHPDVRAYGIGVAVEREGERQAFLATQLFARFAQPTNFATAARDLFTAIAARRASRKLPAVVLDGALSRSAQAGAEAFAAQPNANQDAALARLSRGVRALPGGARALSAALIQAEELGQVVDSEQLLSADLVGVGIGVAPMPSGSERQLAIVLLLALRR